MNRIHQDGADRFLRFCRGIRSGALALVVYLAPMAARADAAPVLKVMTYNIHHGEGVDGKVDLQRIASVIRASGADIVALQETDKGVRRTGGRDLAAELASLTGFTHVFGKCIDLQGGAYGNALLSRYPLTLKENRLFDQPASGEQRGLLHCDAATPFGTVAALSVHLDHRRDSPNRLASAAEIAETIDALGDQPFLLCGDFNARPGSPTYETITRRAVDAWKAVSDTPGFTIPSQKPRARIDYIFTSKRAARLRPQSGEVISSTASDHLPVLITFAVSQ